MQKRPVARRLMPWRVGYARKFWRKNLCSWAVARCRSSLATLRSYFERSPTCESPSKPFGGTTCRVSPKEKNTFMNVRK